MIFNDVTLRVVRSVYYRDGKGWDYPFNQYPYNSLYCVVGGDGSVCSKGVTTYLQPMHAYLIPPNTQFSCKCKSGVEKLYVEFSAEMLPGLDVFSSLDHVCEVPLPPHLFPPYTVYQGSEKDTQLFEVQQYSAISQQMAFQGTMLQILSLFVDDEHTVLKPELYQFKSVLEDINNAMSASVRITEIAKKYGWNPSALSRSFRKHFNCSLKQYIEELLMTRLQQELITSDKTLRELATAYGFSDAYYLSAFFKRRQGIAPSAYRKENKRM